MSDTAFLFSGQGSQYKGMGISLAENFKSAKEIFDTGSEYVGFDILDAVTNYEPEELSKTVVSQPAIMAVSLAAFTAAKESGITFKACAGHSLGEYAAMCASGIVSIDDGFKLIKIRSEAMQKAGENGDGVMCAVIGKNIEAVDEICKEDSGYVLPVNYNSLMQTVIAGEREAVKRVSEKLSGMGYKTVMLAVSSAFHSKFMQSAADEFLEKANDFKFKFPENDFYSNITGEKIVEGDMESFAERLACHIVSPVKFTTELKNMRECGVDTFIEMGPGKVLSGLVRKTLKDVKIGNIEDKETLEKVLGK